MPTRRIRTAGAAFAVVAVLGLGACGGGDDADDPAPGAIGQGDDNEAAAAVVELKPTTFEPADVTIKVGESVTWKWGGGVQHDVDGGDAFKSKLQSRGEFDHTFEEAGTFDYKCNVHPSTMTGTVTVE